MHPGPSRTAIWTATQRAAHLLLDPDPKLLSDTFAGAFAGYDDDGALLRALDDLRPPSTPRTRLRFALRHRYVEDELGKARSHGITRYVILGAGLDSFAYRRPRSMSGLTVYEVDHPASQEWKRARVAQLGIEAPPNLHHVPVDFERQTLGDGLAASGVSLPVPVFFSCVGVTQYLTRDALRTLLRDIAAVAAHGSELLLQFIPPLETLSADNAAEASRFMAHSEAMGEPWLGLYAPAEMEALLRATGFDRVRQFGAEQANELYLRDRPDEIRLTPSFCMASAHVA